MGDYSTRIASVKETPDTNFDFYGKYGYTNAIEIVVSPQANEIGNPVVFHIIPSGSQHFYGDSIFNSAPKGSLGINLVQAASVGSTLHLQEGTDGTSNWNVVTTTD